ncbi:MAG: hypothetical protein J6V72_07895, partial [Kiritimatiellae bacterium]|nr:hypothetical protein [Kiritimatiellia bacterium]
EIKGDFVFPLRQYAWKCRRGIAGLRDALNGALVQKTELFGLVRVPGVYYNDSRHTHRRFSHEKKID